MTKKTDIDNFDSYLNNLFNKKRASNVPDDSFVTYLGNKLKYEFEVMHKKKRETPAFSPPRFLLRPLWAVVLTTILLVLTGTAINLKDKKGGKPQLAKNLPPTGQINKEITTPFTTTKPTITTGRDQEIANLSASEQALDQTDQDITNLEGKLADIELLMSELSKEDSFGSENL